MSVIGLKDSLNDEILKEMKEMKDRLANIKDDSLEERIKRTNQNFDQLFNLTVKLVNEIEIRDKRIKEFQEKL